MTAAVDTPTLPAGVEEIQGTVAQIFFQKPSFCAGRLRSRGRDVSFNVKGFVKLGEPVTLRGKWVTHPKYGRQFEGSEVVFTLPTTPAGVVTWLSWYVPCVGTVKAQKLVDEFGLDLLTLAGTDPNQVAACAGIPVESIHRIAKEWAEYGAKAAAVSELASFGLTQHQVEILYAKFKGSAVTILREDPYLLLREVEGFGFKTVDEIARKLGVPETHPGRKRAAYAAVVALAEQQNKCTAVPDAVVVEKACGLLGLPAEEYGPAVAEQGAEAAIIRQVRRVADGEAGEAFVGVPKAYRHEELLWKTFARAHDPNPYFPKVKSVAFVTENYSRIGDKELDPDQLAAVVAAVSHRVSFVTGGAGSGKTLVARAITKVFADAGVPVRLCAPTGKAARRMTEVIGREASTIHRLLVFKGDGHFEYDATNPLPPGVYIVDEKSMVDCELAYHLFRAMPPQSAVVGIGDPNQLPPVGPGAVLRDVLDHGLAPVARLGHCHRQAGPLKANCAAILDGVVEPSYLDGSPAPWVVHDALDTPEQVRKAVVVLFEKYLTGWGYDPVTDVQFMTAIHKGDLGTRFLNRVVQRLRQKKLGNDLPEPDAKDETHPVLYRGDKVIHTQNNYQLRVMNGTQGVVVSNGRSLVVKYDDRDVEYTAENKGQCELGYVLTPHKAQGSEWPCAVTVCHKLHSFMQTRAWLYTAATRAQKTSVVIGDEQSIRRAAGNDRRETRTTWLDVFARHPRIRPA